MKGQRGLLRGHGIICLEKSSLKLMLYLFFITLIINYEVPSMFHDYM